MGQGKKQRSKREKVREKKEGYRVYMQEDAFRALVGRQCSGKQPPGETADHRWKIVHALSVDEALVSAVDVIKKVAAQCPQ